MHSHSSFDVTFSLHQRRQHVKLQLEPNHDLIWDGAVVEYLDANGVLTHTEPIERADHKVFKGHSWVQDASGTWKYAGWARLTVHRDGVRPLFEGAFTIDDNHHHIQLRSNYMQTKHVLDPHAEEHDVANEDYMVTFRDSDIGRDVGQHAELRRSIGLDVSCPADQLEFNMLQQQQQQQQQLRAVGNVGVLKRETGFWGMVPTGSLFSKRQIDIIPSGGNSAGINLRSSIGQTAGCPNTRKVALVGVATDCTYTGMFNSTNSTRQNVITQMNMASSLWESTFNITLGLANLTVNDATCPGSPQPATPWNQACSSNFDIQARLNAFSRWRGTKVDGNSHWMLLTMCNSGSAVGLAWLGQACVSQVITTQGPNGVNESVSGANVVARTSTEWQVIA